jgi:hypothetical protein
MNDFLINCSFTSNNMGPKFDQFIRFYAIFSRAMCHSAGPWSCAMPHRVGSAYILYKKSAMRHSAGPWSRAMWHSAGPWSRGLARDYGPALSRIARDDTYLSKFSKS